MKRKGKSVKALLRQWSKDVRARDNNECQLCGVKHGDIRDGKVIWLQAHHIEDKMSRATRLLLCNGITLCPTCHKWGKESAHRSPLRFMAWLVANKRQQVIELISAL